MTAPEFRGAYLNRRDLRQDVAKANLEHLQRCLSGFTPGRVGMEIGSFEGGLTRWFLSRPGPLFHKFHVVDPFTGNPEHVGVSPEVLLEKFRQNTAEYRDRLTVHIAKSEHCLPRLLQAEDRFDFIYVDGSHDSRDVILDAVLGFKLLKQAGVMVFDDYLWRFYEEPCRNPGPAIDFFLEAYAPDLEVLVRGYQISIQKL